MSGLRPLILVQATTFLPAAWLFAKAGELRLGAAQVLLFFITILVYL